MKFTPYIKFMSDAGEHVFNLTMVPAYADAALVNEFLNLLPSASQLERGGDLKSLVAKCNEIANIRMNPEIDDDLDYFGSFVDLSNFLEESSRVEMLLRNEPKTVDELVDCAAEGGLDDDWTKIFFTQDPVDKFAQLERTLIEPAKPENYFATIRLLLLCYPRDQVLPVVESFVERVDDEDLKEQAMFLMLVFDQ